MGAGERRAKRPGPAARLLAALYRRGISAWRPRLPPSRLVPILAFHRVSTHRTDHWMTFAPDRFEALLRDLARDWRFIDLAEVDRLLHAGHDVERVVAVCFDDCYGCNARFAVPILRALSVPATFFVASAFVDSERRFPHDRARGFTDLPNFTSAELRTISRDPLFEIGSHTATHVDFSGGPSETEARREMVESKSALEAMTGRPVRRLAIPFGDVPHCSPLALRTAREAGYRRAYSFFGGRNQVRSNGAVGFLLNRLSPIYDEPAYVRARLEGYLRRSSFVPWRRALVAGSDFHPSDLQPA